MHRLPPLPPVALPLALACTLAAGSTATGEEACVPLYRKGIINLPFNPAFLQVAAFPTGNGTETRDALLMSSFFNVEKDPAGEKVTRVFERDLTAWIPDLAGVNPATFDARKELEVLTDRAGEPFRHVWPNESGRVPEGVVPFEAVVVPGGFLATPKPGRITLVNVDDPRRAPSTWWSRPAPARRTAPPARSPTRSATTAGSTTRPCSTTWTATASRT